MFGSLVWLITLQSFFQQVDIFLSPFDKIHFSNYFIPNLFSNIGLNKPQQNCNEIFIDSFHINKIFDTNCKINQHFSNTNHFQYFDISCIMKTFNAKVFIFFLLVYKANTTRLTTSNTFRMIDKIYDPPLSMLFCSPSICENHSNKLSTSKTSSCHVSLNLMTSVTLSFHAHLRLIKPKTLPQNINLPHNLKYILLKNYKLDKNLINQ